jgi:uncharacterized protein YxjI
MATYTIKSRTISVGRDYDVRDANGTSVFTIDGKVRFARTFDVKDRAGSVLCSAKERLLALDQTFHIEAPAASEVTVRRTTSASVYPMTFEIAAGGETTLRAEGSFQRDGVHVTRGAARVASVSRQQDTAVAEIFHVSVADDEDAALMLAVAMVIIEGDPSRGAAATA